MIGNPSLRSQLAKGG